MSPDKQTLDELRIDRRTAPNNRRRPWLAVVGLAAIAVVAGMVWWLNRPKAAVVRTILVQETASGGQKTLLNASGYVTARRQATVSSKVTGKVIEVMVEEGMKIEAGQILARIDSSNVEKGLHLAEAQSESARKALDETKANLEQAEREFARFTIRGAAHGPRDNGARELGKAALIVAVIGAGLALAALFVGLYVWLRPPPP